MGDPPDDPARGATVASRGDDAAGATAATVASGVADATAATVASAGAGAGAGGGAEVPAALPPADRRRYRVVGEVGRGGLGRVLRARDEHLAREVAVKELLDDGGDLRRRFVREAMITARLQHPAIVPVYDAGQGDDGPFYAMKLVSGRSLADALAGATTLEARLALLPGVIAVADAMAYAHSERIIHRDLKPHNVLVGAFGETVVIDWGLAKDLAAGGAAAPDEGAGPYRAAADPAATVAGAMLGTPAYMAPEQAVGDAVDERADVYALGAILYHLIAGAPPHRGRTLDEVLARVLAGDIRPVAAAEPRVAPDLAAIVAKAMAREPADRYPTARELAADLHRFQAGQLVGAHRYTFGERARRWLRRHRAAVAAAAVAAAVLAVYGGWSLSRIVEERGRARAAARAAEIERDHARAQALVNRARQYAATGHTAEELAVLRVLARPDADDASRRLALDAGLGWKAHQRLAVALGRDVGTAVRSADGARLVATVPGALVAWDAATGRELGRIEVAGEGGAAATFPGVVAVTPGGRYALVPACEPGAACQVVANDRGVYVEGARIELRALDDGRVTWALPAGAPLLAGHLTFAPDDAAFARWIDGEAIEVVDAATGVIRHVVDASTCSRPVALGPGGDALAARCDGGIHVWHGGGAPRVLEGSDPLAARPAARAWTSVHVIPGERVVAVASDRVDTWDLRTGAWAGGGSIDARERLGLAVAATSPLSWSARRPRPRAGHTWVTRRPPVVRQGTTTIVRLGVLAPPARPIIGGASVAVGDDGWFALAIHDDRAAAIAIDAHLPRAPSSPCWAAHGLEPRALTPLDGGARVLVDDQELPAAIEAAGPEGYRQTTTAEAPVRWRRPLEAADAPACLVWGGATGATMRDAPATDLAARATADGRGGVVLAGARVRHVDATGAVADVPAGLAPAVSPRGTHVASLDGEAGEVVITDVAARAEVRRWAVPPHLPLTLRVGWAAPDVATLDTGEGVYLVPVDAAHPGRLAEVSAAEPRAPFALLAAPDDPMDAVVVRVHDGAIVARHPRLGWHARVLPDDRGRVLGWRDGAAVVVGLDGREVALAGEDVAVVGPVAVDDTGRFLLGADGGEPAAWRLDDGVRIALPGAVAAAFAGDEVWSITGVAAPRLARAPLAGGAAREVALATPGLPFREARGGVAASPDRRRVTATYAVTEQLVARAIWDAETGALIWVGPPEAEVVGDWVVAGGRAFVPSADLDTLLHDTGARTNLRVCRGDLRAVPVEPPPPPDTYWAPEASCR